MQVARAAPRLGEHSEPEHASGLPRYSFEQGGASMCIRKLDGSGCSLLVGFDLQEQKVQAPGVNARALPCSHFGTHQIGRHSLASGILLPVTTNNGRV